MAYRIAQSSIFFFVSLCALVPTLAGCGNPEADQLRSDLNKAKTENASLQAQITELKRTDSYYYQQGIDQRANKKYEDSIKTLRDMIVRFPVSPLVPKAKEAIHSNREDEAGAQYAEAAEEEKSGKYDSAKYSFTRIASQFGDTSFAAKASSEASGMAARIARNNAEAAALARKQAAEAAIQARKQAAAELAQERAEYRRNAKLEIRHWTWGDSDSDSYLEANGEVKNVSGEPLDNVEAIVSFKDRDGNFVKSGSALIEFRPLLPGQTSPFSVIESNNPEIKKASIEFKLASGEALESYSDKD